MGCVGVNGCALARGGEMGYNGGGKGGMGMLKFGENIRAWRLEKGVTQEKMAESLGVTAQAVSRWETGAACPDIEMLIPLAGYFGRTVDELLGSGGVRREEMVGRAYTLGREGKLSEAEKLCREGLRRYPGDSGLTMALCETLARMDCMEKEAIRLGEAALGSSDVSMKAKSTVTVTLIFLYRRLGGAERAREMTMSLPHLWECREALMGEEDGEALREMVKKLISFAAWKIQENRGGRIPEYVQLGFPFGEGPQEEEAFRIIGEYLRN